MACEYPWNQAIGHAPVKEAGHAEPNVEVTRAEGPVPPRKNASTSKNVADWTTPDAPERERPGRPLRCLTCNEPIEEPLALLGSLRCLACREANTPLDPTLVAEWQARGAKF